MRELFIMNVFIVLTELYHLASLNLCQNVVFEC